MALQFASLGSGSKGNGTLVKSDHCLLLVDCGFTIKETELRMAKLGYNPSDLTAILVTHEHGDHISGVGPLARRYKLPVYLTHGSALYAGVAKLPVRQLIDVHQGFNIEDIDVSPVVVPHDAREPCQFVFQSRGRRLGILTDLGSITPHIVEQYQECDGLMLECNHDLNLLTMGPYPPSLKQRVAGLWGHLNNRQAALFLQDINSERLQHLLISHLSEQNNKPELAVAAIAECYRGEAPISIANQSEGFEWLAIN